MRRTDFAMFLHFLLGSINSIINNNTFVDPLNKILIASLCYLYTYGGYIYSFTFLLHDVHTYEGEIASPFIKKYSTFFDGCLKTTLFLLFFIL